MFGLNLVFNLSEVLNLNHPTIREDYNDILREIVSSLSAENGCWWLIEYQHLMITYSI